MNKPKYAIVTISKQYGEDKALMQNENDMTQSTLIDIEKSSVTKDIMIRVPLDVFQEEKEVLPVQLFEEQLDLTPEQLIAFYKHCSSTLYIMPTYLAAAMKIDKSKAREIINLAHTYELFIISRNCTHKIADEAVRDRWKDAALRLTKEDKQKDRLESGPMTVEEAIAQSNKDMGHDISKSIPYAVHTATGKEVVNEEEFHSPAKLAKMKEREAYEKQSQKASEQLKQEAKGTYVSKSLVRRDSVSSVIEQKKIPLPVPVKKTTTDKPLKVLSQVTRGNAVTPRKIK